MSRLKKTGITGLSGTVGGLLGASALITTHLVRHSNNILVQALATLAVIAGIEVFTSTKQLQDQSNHEQELDLPEKEKSSWIEKTIFGLGFAGIALFVGKKVFQGITELHNPLLDKIFGPVLLGVAGVGALTYKAVYNGNAQENVQNKTYNLLSQYDLVNNVKSKKGAHVNH